MLIQVWVISLFTEQEHENKCPLPSNGCLWNRPHLISLPSERLQQIIQLPESEEYLMRLAAGFDLITMKHGSKPRPPLARRPIRSPESATTLAVGAIKEALIEIGVELSKSVYLLGITGFWQELIGNIHLPVKKDFSWVIILMKIGSAHPIFSPLGHKSI